MEKKTTTKKVTTAKKAPVKKVAVKKATVAKKPVTTKKPVPAKKTPARSPAKDKAVSEVVASVAAKAQVKQITGKAVGKNVILMISGEKYSRSFPTAEERKAVLTQVAAYNAKNTIKAEKDLIKLMEVDKVAKLEETKERATKTNNQKPKEAEVLTDAQKVAAAMELLKQQGYDVTKKGTATYGKSSRGEY